MIIYDAIDYLRDAKAKAGFDDAADFLVNKAYPNISKGSSLYDAYKRQAQATVINPAALQQELQRLGIINQQQSDALTRHQSYVDANGNLLSPQEIGNNTSGTSGTNPNPNFNPISNPTTPTTPTNTPISNQLNALPGQNTTTWQSPTGQTIPQQQQRLHIPGNITGYQNPYPLT